VCDSLCWVFCWVWKDCAGCFIGCDKFVPGVLFGVIICAWCIIGYGKSVPGVTLGVIANALCFIRYVKSVPVVLLSKTSFCRVLYLV
jgi:hypothetical protein